MGETRLWPVVRRFMKKKYPDVLVSEINAGIQGALMDVVLVRGIYKDISADTEVISVEVKPNRNRFLASLGQAYGYSILADKVYLAVADRLSQDEVDISTKIGVGLLEIQGGDCVERASSQKFSPMPDLKLDLLANLNIFVCTICGSFFLDKSPSRNLRNALQNGRSYIYFLEDQANSPLRRRLDKRQYIYNKRHICTDCVREVLSKDSRNFDAA